MPSITDIAVPVRRKSNWPDALTLFVEEKRNQPFDWGHNNCAFFASDWLAILTGEDPAADLRAEVTSALSAARVLQERGGIEKIIEDYCTAHGCLEINPQRAQRGDIATIAVEDDSRFAIGVVVGAQVAYAGLAGLVFAPKALCRRAWRIG